MTVEYGFDFVRDVAFSEAARRGAKGDGPLAKSSEMPSGSPDGELDCARVTAMQTWASASYEQQTIPYGLEYELVLRGCVPPHARARDDIGQLAACTMAWIARTPTEERRTEGRRIVDSQLDEWARRN